MYLIFFVSIINLQQAAKITRNRIQEETAILKEQTSTHVQMIVSAIEASKKEFKTTIKKGIAETRATIPRENIMRNFTKNCGGLSKKRP